MAAGREVTCSYVRVALYLNVWRCEQMDATKASAGDVLTQAIH